MSLSLQLCRETVREEGGSVFLDTIMKSGQESRKTRSIAPQRWTWAAAFIYAACGCPFTLSGKRALERYASMICLNVSWKRLWTAFLENAINKLCSKISISPRDKIFTLLHKQNTQVSNKKINSAYLTTITTCKHRRKQILLPVYCMSPHNLQTDSVIWSATM